LAGFVAELPDGFRYEPGLVVAEGDYVMLHARITGLGPKPIIGVDIFRIADGKIAEHWDVLQEEVPAAETKSGRSMFTGSLTAPAG
jgi:predicted SnoaL-like aldol condensation-catalyzing enzyme